MFPFPAAPQGAHVVVDPTELDELFSRHTEVNIYSLCDLEPPYWTHSRWYRRGDATVGLVSNEPGEPFIVSAVSPADREGSNALLGDLSPELADGQLVIGCVGMSNAIAERRPVKWKTDEIRYVLGEPPLERSTRAQPLGGSHIAQLESLYATEPGAAFFLPSMVASNSFVGIWDDAGKDLIAAAGTHVLSEPRRVAAIGAVYVRPDHRGNGLGKDVTLGVLERLADRIDTIGLNSSRSNTPARQIYERLGFQPILDFEEAKLE